MSSTNTPFWRAVFSESDGAPSFSRVATGLIVAFAMGWVTALVRTNHQLPDFGGLVLLIGALYGVNKFSGAIGSRSEASGFGTRGGDRPEDRSR